jgi:hypothetical protein
MILALGSIAEDIKGGKRTNARAAIVYAVR